jgi:hypothetical protein
MKARTMAKYANAKKMTGVEKLDVSEIAVAEIDRPAPGSASRVQAIKFRGTWLIVRRLSKIPSQRPQRPQLNFNSAIKPI